VTGKIHIGVAGWSYPDWEGPVYPKPKPKGFDPLVYLAEFIDLIEINSTFYHPGSERNPKSWVRRLAGFKDFRFTVKLWQKFGHDREGVGAKEVAQARIAPEVLSEAGLLGAALVQFPWSFRNNQDNRAWLFKLADWFGDLNLAIELRHGSWDRPEVFKMFEDIGAALVGIDQPMIGESIGPTAAASGPVAYVRLHGRNREHWFNRDSGRDDRYNYLYSADELAPWRDRALAMAEGGREVYVVANNHYKGQALANALQLKFMLGQPANVPPALAAAFPESF